MTPTRIAVSTPHTHQRYLRASDMRNLLLIAACSLACVVVCGCTNGTRFPGAHDKVAPHVVHYDVSGNGKVDYRQQMVDGVKQVLEWDRDGDGQFEHVVDRQKISPQDTRLLVLFLDGVPYQMMDQLWREGRFRLCYPPSRLIGSFPSVTETSAAAIFAGPRAPGYEACYFDRSTNRETVGSAVHLAGHNEPWSTTFDFHLSQVDDALLYVFPGRVASQELQQARLVFDVAGPRPVLVFYFRSPDALGYVRSWEVAKANLRRIDDMLERMAYDSQGTLQIIMFGDHGNTFADCTIVDLPDRLRRAGLSVVKTLQQTGDVVVPVFGLVSFGCVYTYDADTRHKAVRVLQALEAVDLVVYRDGNDIWVVQGDARARIQRSPVNIDGLVADVDRDMLRYRYEAVEGDPLALVPVLRQLGHENALDENGFASDRDWLAATWAHEYPDPLYRIDRALTDYVHNVPDIVVSLKRSYCSGDPSLAAWVDLKGTHGALRVPDSMSFFMHSFAAGPEYARPDEVLGLINQHVWFRPRIAGVEWPKVIERRLRMVEDIDRRPADLPD